jgi:CPA2 family monovalent cation:H+ antiporter-2
MTVMLLAGLLFVPRLIGYVARFKSNEMMIITVLALCFGSSLLAAKLGYSVALGAFLIGAIIAEAREIHRIEALAEPVRDMFSAIFFVAIGLLIDPKVIVEHWLPVLVITLAVIIGKVVTCAFGAFVGGNDGRTSLRVGMGLAQIGEFSFIIASLGLSLNVTSKFLYPIAVSVSVLTTLLTPYLIKSSDGVINWFERVAPKSLRNSLEIYTRWVGQLGGRREGSFAAKLIRRWLAQMALNVVVITAVFIAAGYLERHPSGWLVQRQLGEENLKMALWLAAAVISLPMFIATFRKLQALGMLLAELKVSAAAAGARTPAIRAVVAQVVAIAGMALLGLYVLELSSTLLPSPHIMLILLAIVLVIAWLLWRSFIKVYSKAQVALQETLAQSPPPRVEPPPALPALLRDADLETLTLSAASPAVGKLIREIELRSKTGASIVGIERGGTSLVNPGPDEELQPGDQILLLGTRSQLDAGRAALNPTPQTASGS